MARFFVSPLISKRHYSTDHDYNTEPLLQLFTVNPPLNRHSSVGWNLEALITAFVRMQKANKKVKYVGGKVNS